jgi:hypothetical protein
MISLVLSFCGSRALVLGQAAWSYRQRAIKGGSECTLHFFRNFKEKGACVIASRTFKVQKRGFNSHGCRELHCVPVEK